MSTSKRERPEYDPISVGSMCGADADARAGGSNDASSNSGLERGLASGVAERVELGRSSIEIDVAALSTETGCMAC